jgi:hypothetical protein
LVKKCTEETHEKINDLHDQLGMCLEVLGSGLQLPIVGDILIKGKDKLGSQEKVVHLEYIESLR